MTLSLTHFSLKMAKEELVSGPSTLFYFILVCKHAPALLSIHVAKGFSAN